MNHNVVCGQLYDYYLSHAPGASLSRRDVAPPRRHVWPRPLIRTIYTGCRTDKALMSSALYNALSYQQLLNSYNEDKENQPSIRELFARTVFQDESTEEIVETISEEEAQLRSDLSSPRAIYSSSDSLSFDRYADVICGLHRYPDTAELANCDTTSRHTACTPGTIRNFSPSCTSVGVFKTLKSATYLGECLQCYSQLQSMGDYKLVYIPTRDHNYGRDIIIMDTTISFPTYIYTDSCSRPHLLTQHVGYPEFACTVTIDCDSVYNHILSMIMENE